MTGRAMGAEIQLQEVPPGRGLVWLRQGLRVFAHRPLAFSLLLMSALVSMVLIAVVPVFGPILSQAAQPLVWLGFMVATQLALRGQVPMPDVFVRPLRVDRPRTLALLKLCALYVVAMQLVWVAANGASSGQLAAAMSPMPAAAPAASGASGPDAGPGSAQAPEPSADEAMAEARARAEKLSSDPAVHRGLLTFAVLVGLLSVPYWHAMALVHWGGHTMAKALFFSVVGMWRARWAFLLYGVGSAVGLSVAGMVCGAVLLLIGKPQWATPFFMSLSLIFVTVMLASVFFTFVDTFVSTATPPAKP